MRMDSEMIGILLSDSMHYTIVVSLEMSDEPKERLRLKSQLAAESIGRHHAALVSKSVNRQMGLSPKEQKKTIYE